MTNGEWNASTDPAAMLKLLTDSADYHGPVVLPVGNLSRRLRLLACACCRACWDVATCTACGGEGRYDADNVATECISKMTCRICHGSGKVGGLTDPRSRRAVEVAEKFADGEIATDEVVQTDLPPMNAGWEYRLTWETTRAIPATAAEHSMRITREQGVLPATQADLIRDIFGDPFRPVAQWSYKVCHRCGGELAPLKKDILPLLSVCRTCSEDGPFWASVVAGQKPDWITPAVVQMAESAYSGRAEDGSLDALALGVIADALEESGCDDGAILRHLRGAGPHVKGCWVVDLLLEKE